MNKRAKTVKVKFRRQNITEKAQNNGIAKAPTSAITSPD
jgi:hypothetical protein